MDVGGIEIKILNPTGMEIEIINGDGDREFKIILPKSNPFPSLVA